MVRRNQRHSRVAPYTGAWIEICWKQAFSFGLAVAPYTGAWIEIEYYGHG
ncbi:hypothetical protein [Caproicibacterium sp. XB2]